MKYLILPAKKLQCGDVVFASDDEGKPLLGRVLGQNFPHPDPRFSEYRLEIVVGAEETEAGARTTIRFPNEVPLGVAREDDFVDVDVSALLADLDD